MAGALGLAADQPFLVVGQRHGDHQPGSLPGGEPQRRPDHRSGRRRRLDAAVAARRRADHAGGLAPPDRLPAHAGAASCGFRSTARSGRRAGGADVTANSENVDVVARGEADIGRQIVGPKGMAGSAWPCGSCNRVVGWPPMGGARFAGTFTGRPTTASSPDSSARRAQCLRLPAGAGQRSGEVRLGRRHGGTTMVQASLDGEGGAGAGSSRRCWAAGRTLGDAAGLAAGRADADQVADVAGPGSRSTGAGQRGSSAGSRSRARPASRTSPSSTPARRA